jgi:hypothetical protein
MVILVVLGYSPVVVARGMSVSRSNGKGERFGMRGHADARARALEGVLRRLHGRGITSYRMIAETLNAEQVPTPRGGRWSKTSVARLVTRLRDLEPGA